MVVSARSWVANEGGKHFVLILWLGVNTWLFISTFLLYFTGQQYHYLYKMLGLGLCISRASATVLNLNCSLVLLPMCRSLVTFVRGTRMISSRKTRRLLDKSKTFHVACGVAICIFSVMHVSAHLVNVVRFSVRYSEDFPALNLARYRGEDPMLIILTTIPGVTGVLLVLILFLMFISSSYCVRVSNYEIFWYTHNLFIVFYVILMIHMVGGALKYQTNIEAHPPGCFRANQSSTEQQGDELDTSEEEERRCNEDAHFQPHYPQTWLWVSGPLCLYCVERFYRYIQSRDPVTIVTVIRHPCDVVELRMLKKNFKARPGQHILLNCPGVSSFENHPFTLTMCPTENKETLGIHLRVVGDWTERFTQLLLPEPRIDMEILPMAQKRRYPKVYVDGPFGGPSEEVFNYDVSLCVAGGIGVTPFACVLRALLDGWMGFRLQRLYFVWVCKELQSFYWFAELLCALHHKLWNENRPDYFNLKLYISQPDSLQSMSEEKYRPLTSRMQIGRPRWKLLFDEIGKSNKHKRVGVFCCGPKGISRTLHRLCNSAQYNGTTFEFNKESFS
ncbi:NADPH oxidase 4 isoform X2 [Neolamprologus brichardi]|uniref:NADPH oxidase 4 isoform X1 n=1 Tax=Neolamprologus brichardi TaxID=32507 RepID=UPI0003EC2645|nr:NADPH oxidase 4 isoform X1 [Neolamprologus brichardi]XP_035768552.1 NADPH oxidase 4 isoform X2 [Neolamprologus brichardi]